MGIDPDNGGGEHEGISAEMVKKMIADAHKHCDMLINDDSLLKGSINNIKNAKGSTKKKKKR